MKKIKGFTIVELLVAMTIFLVVATLAIGAFVAVTRTKALTSNMKESQQKIRIALEMITRLSRQADKVIVTGQKTLYVFYNNGATSSGSKFYFDDTAQTLYLVDCTGYTTDTCTGTPNDLFGGSISLDTTSHFSKDGTIPPRLNIVFDGKIEGSSSPYFTDTLSIETSVILENIK